MEATVTASDVRHQFPEIVRRVQRGETLIAISRPRPVFRIVPMQQAAGDVAWLDRVACAYPDDRMFIDLARSGNAHLLVAGDVHLLALKQTGHTPVVTAAHALEVLRRLRPPVDQ